MNADSRESQEKKIQMSIKEITKVRKDRGKKNKISYPCASLIATYGGGGVDITGEEHESSLFQPRYQTWVNSNIHIPADYPPRKETPVLTEFDAG